MSVLQGKGLFLLTYHLSPALSAWGGDPEAEGPPACRDVLELLPTSSVQGTLIP